MDSASLHPREFASLDWLKTIPLNWIDVHWDRESDARQKALLDLIYLGWVEVKLVVEISVLGNPRPVRLRCRARGCFGAELKYKAFTWDPKWHTGDTLKVQIELCWTLERVRLTGDGERLQRWVSSDQDSVLKLLRRRAMAESCVGIEEELPDAADAVPAEVAGEPGGNQGDGAALPTATRGIVASPETDHIPGGTGGTPTSVDGPRRVEQEPAVADNPPDGPEAPDRFWYKGRSEVLTPIPWKLLDCLWSKKPSAVSSEDIVERVWGHDQNIGDTAITNAKNRANNALVSLGTPFKIRKLGNYLRLE